MRRSPAAYLIAILSTILAAGPSCGGKKSSAPTLGEPTPGDKVLVQHEDDTPPGLTMRLGDGKDPAYQPVRMTPAKTTRLSDGDARALLDRMPALAGQTDDKKDFALRERSTPAPRTGKLLSQPFPPPASASATVPPAKTDTGPLEVVRFAPEGDVPLAPQLSVTFSRPMVAITSHGDTATHVPVTLEPAPAGRWRWIGTRTLLFDPDTRFPQATEYKATVPAGTRSATGNTLAREVTWNFATPPPRLMQSWPAGDSQPRDVAMFAAFDQQIDPAAVLATISVRAGGKDLAVRALTDKEIAANRTIKDLLARATAREHGDRVVVFRAKEPLPVDAAVGVTIGPGTPSREGPLKTQKPQSFSFRTYGPLKVEEARCSWGTSCAPLTPWYVRFSNLLDVEAFDPATIEISPALPGQRVEASGSTLYIRGQSKGQTTYSVTLPAGLKDEFGQPLGREQTLTFRVGSADPRFFGPSGLVVLDPMAKRPTLDMYTINVNKLKVRLYTVTPGDWAGFTDYMANYRRPAATAPPGILAVDKMVDVKGAGDELVETSIDLGPALPGGLGHVVAVIEPASWPHSGRAPRTMAWVQSTRIGLDAFVDATDMVAWASRLEDGAPLADVKIEILPVAKAEVTDTQGMARLSLPVSTGKTKGPALVVATRGRDTAFVPESRYWWGGGGTSWVKRDLGESLRWYVFDDRAMYRPGEDVHVKGWVRRVDNRKGGGLDPLDKAATQISYKVHGPRGNEIGAGTAKVNALGGFDTRFTVPKTPNLGWARITFQAVGKGALQNRSHSHVFQIQEFRRPEYEVSVKASQGPHMVGQSADVTVKASYYASGALANAEVNWSVSASPASFTPPNRDDYIFGIWQPWWGMGIRGEPYPRPGILGQMRHQARTDAAGRHILHIDFVSVNPPRPMKVNATASIMDVNRQAWASSAGLLVHPAAFYVGLKSDAYFVDKGEPIEYEVIVVDHDGKAVAGKPVSVAAVRLDWFFEKGEYVTRERDEQRCDQVSAAAAHVCSFDTKEGGQYRITAEVVDNKGRRNQTQVTVWVSGGKQAPARNVEKERVTLIPDKKEYQPGDTAEILVQAPFFPAQGLMSVRRSGIITTERFVLKDASATLKVPIVDTYVPNVHVQVDLVGAAARLDDQGQPAGNLPDRPAFASGELSLSVPPLSRVLRVDIAPRARKLAPGEDTAISVRVRDAAGKPVAGAELAVVVEDESVLALSSYELADPMAAFYAMRPAGVNDYYLRELVKLTRPEVDTLGGERDGLYRQAVQSRLEVEKSGAMPEEPVPAPPPAPPGTAGKRRKGGGEDQGPIMLRKNFNALAVFAPEVMTDARGTAVVQVKMPDNLTRYRVMAVAVAGDARFGKGESSIIVRLPLMVRPSAPRFLNFGDTFELPVVIHNQTDSAMDVRVAVRALNTRFTDGHGRRLSVASKERVEVRFPAAAELPGTARFQVAAASGRWSDASEFALPVWTPVTTEAFASYGEIDNGAIRQPVALPGQVIEQFGGLELTTSSTQLQALTDAFLYLVDYPFQCAEQISSRVVAVAALRDVLSTFEAEGLPPPAEIVAAVARDIERLRGMQNYDGGFGFWQRGNPSWPYVSVHAIHALTRAKAKGFDVPQDMLDRGRGYLRDIEKKIPGWYSESVRLTLLAYALSVRKTMGDAHPARARALVEKAGLDNLSLEAVGWLLDVMSGDRSSRDLVGQIYRHLGNRATETAGTVHLHRALCHQLQGRRTFNLALGPAR